MLLRLRSRDGLDRITIEDGATVGQLQKKIVEQLSVSEDDQILSTQQGLLLSKSPENFVDMRDKGASLASLGISHGSVVFWSYTAERSIAGPPVMTPAGAFGRKMTVEDMIAKQTRIERQEQPLCLSVSFDRNAANVFQQYVNESLAFSIKRGGFMYGTVSEEGEVAVDFIYEPPQQGTEDSLALFRDEDEEKHVEAVAAGLGLRRVGFIFTQAIAEERDYTMSNAEIRQAAELHAESEFDQFAVAIVKLETSEEGGADVHFEAFQLSKQCVKLFKEEWFVDSPETPAKLSRMKADVILVGKDVQEVDNDFFLVPVKILDHEGLLKASFPVENRIPPPSELQLRQHLERTKGRPFYERIADFHLLLFLSRFLDINTDMPQLTEAVRIKGPVPDGYQLIIESF